MTIRDIAIAFGFELDKASETGVENSIKGIKNMATTLLGSLGVFFSIQGLSSLAQAAADAEALNSQFEQVFGEMEVNASEKLDAIAEDTGIMVNRMKGSYTQIAGFAKTTGLSQEESLEIAERAMIAVADSAAFYDRSIESAADSLQSFLKGNYANDAALGLSATETTRNAAANELYGKSFKDLSEAQKQLTLLKMVEDANRLSGALGQATRESDTWGNQLGNLKQNLKDLQANVGKTFLKPAVNVLKFLSFLVKKVSDGISNLTKENGFLTKSAERMQAIYHRIKPIFERIATFLTLGFKNGVKIFQSIVEKLGGVENALKILAIVAATIPIVLNWSKMISKIKTFISTMSGLFNAANIKILSIIAVIVILALIVEDFIAFMSGKDSVIGSIFEKFGIDAEDVKEKIITAWNSIVDFLSGTWKNLEDGVGMFVDMIRGFIDEHGSEIRKIFERTWGIVSDFISGVLTFIGELFGAIFGNAESDVTSSNESMKDGVMSNWQIIIDYISKALNSFFNLFSSVFNAVASLVEAIFSWIQAFWSRWGEDIISQYQTVFESVVNIFSNAFDILIAVVNFFTAILTGDWGAAWDSVVEIFSSALEIVFSSASATFSSLNLLIEIVLTSISDFFSSIFDGIVSNVTSALDGLLSGISTIIGDISSTIIQGFDEAVEFITGLPDKAVTWGLDFMNGLVDGIAKGVQNVVNAVSDVGSKIKEYLHFSVPDKGPLTDYETWMPDFMSGLAKGIGDNEAVVLRKVKELAGGMKMLMQSGTASVATATNSRIGNNSTNMTQNVSINNSYTGGTPETQKAVAGTMKKSAQDATTYMARGLAYARG